MLRCYWLTLILSLGVCGQCMSATKLEDEGVNQGYINVLNIVGGGAVATKSGIKGTVTFDIPTTASDIPIVDAGSIITATETEGALQENRTAINLNTAKNTNVSTTLEAGTVNATTYGITSDGGADDIVLPEADTTNAGLLGSDKWDEIVANTNKTTNATHTGEVTGATALAVNPTAISNKADTTIAAADHLLFLDATDSTLKKVDAGELLAGTGDLKADGTVPLTANWDVGAFNIHASTFTSDQATGTAPFTVASTTEVANLNSATVTNATLTTALTVDTGTVGLTGNVANSSVLTLGAGASSISGSNTGDQTINTVDIADVSVEQTELAELETVGATTISANQWATLGGIAETLTNTELNLLDGITVLSGSNTGDDTVATSGDSATAFFNAGTIEHERGGLEADVNAYTGLVKINAGSTSDMKVNWAAAAPPAAATDDITLGYIVGSSWHDTTNDKSYVCLDNTDGAAVWTETTQAGGAAETLAATLAAGADANDLAITSLAKLEGFDALVYVDLGTDGKIILEADTEVEITSPLEVTGLVTLTSGQIKFPATAVPSADPNTIDDYEEGTWALTITPATSGTITLDASGDTGAYTKVGRKVSVQGWCEISSYSSPVGDLQINLPFATANLTERAGYTYGTVAFYNMTFTADYCTIFAAEAVSYCKIHETISGGLQDFFEGADLTSPGNIYFSFTYFIG